MNETVIKVAKNHAAVAREREDQWGIEKPVDVLVADVSSAIDRATDLDEREINDNFDVDWQASGNSMDAATRNFVRQRAAGRR